MNPDFPQTPRDEVEQRLTALLLGELSAEESAALHRAMEQDGELAKLFARLHHTVGLVRETVAKPGEHISEPAAPAKLSTARREKLLAHFKTITPPEFGPAKRRGQIRLLEVAAVLAICALLAAMLLPALSASKSKSKSAMVQSNVRQIEVAKQLWAEEYQKSAGDAPTMEDLKPYLGARGDMPSVRGETYVIGRVGEPVVADYAKASAAKAPEEADSQVRTALSAAEARPAAELAFRTWNGDSGARAKAGYDANRSGLAEVEFYYDADVEKLKRPVGVTPLKSRPVTSTAIPNPVVNYGHMADADVGNGRQGQSQVRGDPEWVGVLEQPAGQPTAGAFISRNAFFADENVAQPKENEGADLGVTADATPAAPATLGTEFSASTVTGVAGEVMTDGLEAGQRYYRNISGFVTGSAGGGLPASVATDSSADRSGGVDLYRKLRVNQNRVEGNSVLFDLGAGDLTARGTAAESEHLKQINEALAAKPPEVNLKAKFAEVAQNDDRALGYDWYLGNGVANDKSELATPANPTASPVGSPTVQRLNEGTVITASGRIVVGSVPDGGRIAPEPVVSSGDVAGSVNGPARRQLSSVVLPGAVAATTPRPTMTPADAKKSLSDEAQDVSLRVTNNLIAQRQRGLKEQSVSWNYPALARLKNGADAVGVPIIDDQPIRKPATNAPIPQPEIPTSENNFSTFSLNVSDVSFKLAAASLEKGQMPDAASIRSEEFINAFDYRDPEPAAGAPIAFAYERARYPFAHNRDLLRFSLKTAAAGRQAGRPLNIVLLLDNSGSMERADRVQIIREALRVLASQLQPQDKLSVIMFARTARLVADGIAGDQAGEVAEQVSGITPQGGTNLEDAMNLAYQTATKHYLAKGINRVVLLTDGAANLGDVEPESLKQKVEAQRQQGIALDCFGIGWEGLNDDLLEVLSRNGDGRYGFINSSEEAATDFVCQLAGALKVAASDVKVQVEFNPKRVTAYRQIGYAKHQLTKEQFRDNTVDAAEIAAQEAGNALYTVEVNPAGSGPLCTVRVRYKVPGTTDYREQAWDVPYTGNAATLEQSSPAMRLAASASAFAEWLVASPFAGEVTPERVLGYLSGVPEVFGADARPKKLEWMIRQAKSLEGK